MKRTNWLIALMMLGTTTLTAQQTDPAQQEDPIAVGFGGVASVVGETRSPEVASDNTVADSAAQQVALAPQPVWKQKLYYGYNFDIYYHNDSRSNTKENGWSIAVEPEIGWRLKERVYLGLRFGGSYQDSYLTYTVSDLLEGNDKPASLRVQQGTWNVTPYMRYRMKTMFDGKLGIWLEAHAYAGMEFPRVADNGNVTGTNYEGLKHSITYGVQVSPVITYQFNKKSTFQIFLSILSAGYSGTTFCYVDPDGSRRKEYTNDVIIFSGKLRNLIANQFTPGLYGLKFGVQKSF